MNAAKLQVRCIARDARSTWMVATLKRKGITRREILTGGIAAVVGTSLSQKSQDSISLRVSLDIPREENRRRPVSAHNEYLYQMVERISKDPIIMAHLASL